jgi:hypothetical protein
LHSDKFGNELRRFDVHDGTVIVADFTANLENLFNFDIAISRRVEISGSRLKEIARELQTSSEERQFAVSRIREVG